MATMDVADCNWSWSSDRPNEVEIRLPDDPPALREGMFVRLDGVAPLEEGTWAIDKLFEHTRDETSVIVLLRRGTVVPV